MCLSQEVPEPVGNEEGEVPAQGKKGSQRAVPKYPRTATIQTEKASINSQEQTLKKQENDLSDQQRVNKFHYGPSEG